MTSSSTMKANCYNFINNNLRSIIDNKFDRTNSSSFDSPEDEGSKGGSGSRSTRASSLALPNNSLLDLFDKEQSFLNPVNLKPTITTSIRNTISNTVNSFNKLRRHSSHQFAETEREDGSTEPPSTPASATSNSDKSSSHFNSGFVFFTSGLNTSRQAASSVLSNDNLLLHQHLTSSSSKSPNNNSIHSMNGGDKLNLKGGSSFGGGSGGVTGSSRGASNRYSAQHPAHGAVPPPVPKRTFQGKINSMSKTNGMKKSNTIDRDDTDSGFYIPSRKNYMHQQNRGGYNNHKQNGMGKGSKGPGRFSSMGSITMSNRDEEMPESMMDEDRLSIESSVFEDGPYSAHNHHDQVTEMNDYFSQNYVFDENNSSILTKKMLSSSNRSSSDSNKSQTTIDTGYMSSNTSTASAVTTNTENDRQITNSQFRSRFSSEDTQSSLDSFMSSSDLQQRLQTTNGNHQSDSLCYSHTSIIDNSGVDVIEYLQKNSARNCPNNNPRTTTSQNTISHNSPSSNAAAVQLKFDHNTANPDNGQYNGESDSSKQHLPKVPDRKQQQPPSGLPNIAPPPPSVKTKSPATARARGPPAPPLRSQASFDSTKLGSGSQIFGTRQSSVQQKSPNGDMTRNNCTTTTASVHGGPRKGLNGIMNKPPPLTQIHHHKINQRQDSSISSDSFSVTSSPGYNSKSMEAPLIQHPSKINRSVFRHQDSSDSFGMTIRNAMINNSNRKMNSRQDSNISSDSFSITSSPGYNSKQLMEAPLLAHTSKLHTSKRVAIIFCYEMKFAPNLSVYTCVPVKQGFTTAEMMIPRGTLLSTENNPTSPIIKSASTPASLQTIVRFQSGSNMSLQHKVSHIRSSGVWEDCYQ